MGHQVANQIIGTFQVSMCLSDDLIPRYPKWSYFSGTVWEPKMSRQTRSMLNVWVSKGVGGRGYLISNVWKGVFVG